MSRRGLLLGAGAASVAASLRRVQAAERAVDHTIRIGPVSLELAPGKTIKTIGYNDSVPGQVLRLREGLGGFAHQISRRGRLVAAGPFEKPTDASGNTLQARRSRSRISAHWAAVFAWVNFSAHSLAR